MHSAVASRVSLGWEVANRMGSVRVSWGFNLAVAARDEWGLQSCTPLLEEAAGQTQQRLGTRVQTTLTVRLEGQTGTSGPSQGC